MSPELHPGYYKMCGKCNSFWMSWCFSGWVVVEVRWCFWANLQPGCMDRWDKDSADALEIYQGQGWPWIPDSWAPDTVFRLAITGMACPSWQHHLPFFTCIPGLRTRTGHILKKVVMTNYTRNLYTWWSTNTNTSPYHVFIFLAILSVHLCHKASSTAAVFSCPT